LNTLEIKSEITICHLNELTTSQIELIESSKNALNLSHSPYSKFKVGCALRLDNNLIVQGANQENAAYPMCLCAEGVTLASVASQHPIQKIVDVAIHVPIDTPASPCGFCRQSFKEYETRMNTKFNYYLIGNEDIYIFKGIDTILPLAFSSKDLM
jgi:cytidine deaminase